MAEGRFNPTQKRVIDSILDGMPGVSERKTFGHPAYYIRVKMFATLAEDGLALKLPYDVVEELVRQAVCMPWVPGGAAMGSWFHIVLPDAEAYRSYTSYLEQSVEYVSQQAARG